MNGRAVAGSTPAALGYRMPAEWEPHAATWIAWPHERTDWPGPGKLEAVRWAYGEVIRHLAPGEIVRVLVEDEKAERQIGANFPGQSSFSWGHASHVAACGSHSAGMR